MFSLFLSLIQLIMFILRLVEKKGKVRDARLALEADLLRISREFEDRAATARAAVDHSPDSVQSDPDNRDTTEQPNSTDKGSV